MIFVEQEKGVSKFPTDIDRVIPIMKGFDFIINTLVVLRIIGININE